MTGRLPAALAIIGALSCPFPARQVVAADPGPASATVPCAECGMSAEIAGRFTSRLVSGGATRYFCDIGDLVSFVERTHPKEYVAGVRDFPTGEWLDAGAAFFVIDKKAYATPMGWGVAAYRDRTAATGTALDFEALRKALR